MNKIICFVDCGWDNRDKKENINQKLILLIEKILNI